MRRMGVIDRAIQAITHLGTNRRLLSEMKEHMNESHEIRRQLRELIARSLEHSGPEATLQALGHECKTTFGAERLQQTCDKLMPKEVSEEVGK